MTESSQKPKTKAFFSHLSPQQISSNTKRFLIILLAVGLTLTAFVIIPLLEPATKDEKGNLQCKYAISGQTFVEYLICRVANSKLLGQVQNFSIVIAAFLYILDRPERKKQAERQAWQLIDGARGSETSGARFQAIEELCEKGVFLNRLDADGADLIEINLQGANLERANLQGADLQGAKLQNANLYQAKLQNAKLQGADLCSAYLWGINLEGAQLQERDPDIRGNKVGIQDRITNLQRVQLGRANLRKAVLQNANLQGADLRGACIQEADLRNADLRGAKLYGARLGGALNLSLEQVKLAKDWEKAKYDKKFCLAHPELNLLQDKTIKEISVRTTREESIELKLLGLVHKILINHELDKKKEIAEIRKKIAELIQIVDSKKSVSLQNNSVVEELTIAVESLIEEDEAIRDSSTELEADIREKLANVHTAIHQGNKEYEEAEQLDKQADAEQEPYLIAVRWLISNHEIVRKRGISCYLARNPEVKLTGGILDSTEKIKQIEEDIDNCLKQLSVCLSKPEKPHYWEIELNLPIPIQSEIFRVILEQVIPKILSKHPDALTEQALDRLKYFFQSSISELQQKSDFNKNRDI